MTVSTVDSNGESDIQGATMTATTTAMMTMSGVATTAVPSDHIQQLLLEENIPGFSSVFGTEEDIDGDDDNDENNYGNLNVNRDDDDDNRKNDGFEAGRLHSRDILGLDDDEDDDNILRRGGVFQ